MIITDKTIPSPEYLAMVAMIESGIVNKETYSRTEHWNNQNDSIHIFWNKFNEYLKMNGYEIITKVGNDGGKEKEN